MLIDTTIVASPHKSNFCSAQESHRPVWVPAHTTSLAAGFRPPYSSGTLLKRGSLVLVGSVDMLGQQATRRVLVAAMAQVLHRLHCMLLTRTLGCLDTQPRALGHENQVWAPRAPLVQHSPQEALFLAVGTCWPSL